MDLSGRGRHIFIQSISLDDPLDEENFMMTTNRIPVYPEQTFAEILVLNLFLDRRSVLLYFDGTLLGNSLKFTELI